MTTDLRFWRTLDELADDPAFLDRVHKEFPSEVEAITDPVARRTFLKLMGASLALAGVTACTRQPLEHIVPYVRQPEEIVPGRPLFFATAMTLGGVAQPLLVESHEGRPTKIEGNPQHAASLGATDVHAQAAILTLYDPDRSQTLTELGDIRPWSSFLGAMRAALTAQDPLKGAGIRLLTESIGSPTLADQIRRLLQRYPQAKWHQWDPASRNAARMGSQLAFGDHVSAQYRVDRADVILAIDADFLACGPGSLRHAHDFASRRRPEIGARMNRLYAVECMPSSTGSRADHRLPLKASQIGAFAAQVASSIGASVSGAPAVSDVVQKWAAAVARDLQAHRGASLVVAGDGQPAEVHALAHLMNQTLGNVGRTVVYTEPVEAEPVDQLASLQDLVADMNAGKVDLLIMLGGNPVYTAPPDLKFGDALGKVQSRVHLSLHDDETSVLCQWQIPEAHFLEAWSDARAYDGTVSIVQPLIAPLYGGRSAHEVLAALSDQPERSAHDLIRDYWNAQLFGAARPRGAQAGAAQTRPGHFQGESAAGSAQRGPGQQAFAAGAREMRQLAPAPSSGPALNPDFENNWRRWLHDGFIPNTAFAPRSVTARPVRMPASAESTGLDVSFRNDPSVLDGRFANNGWLQELPKPITKLTWDNAVLVSPATAERLNLGNQPAFRGGEHGNIVSDIVELRVNGSSVRGAIFPVVGHADDCVTVHLGYGRSRAGHIGTNTGFDANVVRRSNNLLFATGATIVNTGDRYPLACTQYHHLMEGRHTVRAATLEDFMRDPRVVHEGDETPPRTLTLYPEYRYDNYKWGMSIDLSTCIGCNACVVACQSENNIPVVGKDEVMRGREMHWLRIDTYYRGEARNPESFFQPVPCMQCENAPCEVVCPVGATVHSADGLNDMVYNRCVGTRYCSNNCPYKVRRFNFLLYQDWETPSLKLGRNPDVTVRSRGVMEKCTYCVQRINAARIESEKQDRRVADGEIETACQAVCPADAIVFGDLNDPNSRVSKLKALERDYALLGELNTRPRTTYLAAVRNVNPELANA